MNKADLIDRIASGCDISKHRQQAPLTQPSTVLRPRSRKGTGSRSLVLAHSLFPREKHVTDAIRELALRLKSQPARLRSFLRGPNSRKQSTGVSRFFGFQFRTVRGRPCRLFLLAGYKIVPHAETTHEIRSVDSRRLPPVGDASLSARLKWFQDHDVKAGCLPVRSGTPYLRTPRRNKMP